MKEVIKHLFVAKDGAEFTDKGECQKYEWLISSIEEIMLPLGKRPTLQNCQFFQHSKDVFLSVRDALVCCAAEECDHPEWEAKSNTIHQHSILGRILDDRGGPLRNAWYRLMCFSNDGKEWDQPFFAIEANKSL